jgi:hypothetical protein
MACWISTLCLVAAMALAFAAGSARAQDDGPRVYQLVPLGSRNFTAFGVVKRGNESADPGSVSPGSDTGADLVVLRYVQTFDLAGRSFSPFVILPLGEVRATGAPASSGVGDAQLGATLGLVGAPALSAEAFASYRPGFGVAVLGRVFLPTGAYSSDQPVNFGSNRFTFQIGLPAVIAAGRSYRDPALTSLEVLPTLTFYGPNETPFTGGRSAKDPLFGVEAHLTRNLGRRVWLSADVLYRGGGETSTDGLANADAMSGWSAGGSLAFPFTARTSLILTWEHVVARNDDGPDGWFFRTALVAPF